MVIVIARVRPRPDRREELMALLEEVQAASRGDDGCLHYGYHAEITDPDALVAVEEWRDADALAAHLHQPHVARLVAALPDMLAARPEIVAHDVARSGPLPLPS
jgi:quinol monooxygenase YgiN